MLAWLLAATVAAGWAGPAQGGVVALTGSGLVAAEHAPAGSEHGAAEAHHEESLFSLLSRLVNFALLAGGIYYLVRTPLARYLAARAEQIRGDLLNAAETRRAATEQLRAVEARLRELPAEIAALEARGRAEIEAERQRIREAAAAERQRLLEVTRREIDQQLQAARRALKQEVADLAISIARARVSREITAADQLRLVDRYVAQVQAVHD